MTKQDVKQIRTNPKTVQTRSGSGKQIAKKTPKVQWNFPLTRSNLIIGAIGLGVILLGFILMATGISDQPALADGKWNNPLAVSVAPVLLVLGYCVIIPYALLKFFGKKKEIDDNPVQQ